jgi:hypothetical protein
VVSTDLLEGTDLAAVRMPEGMVGFGHGELACLLSRHPGPAVGRSAEALRVDLAQVSEEIQRAGLSSLLARGLVQQEPDRFSPRSSAALLDYAAGAAERWTTIEIVHAQAPDLAVVLHAPQALALLQPRALGTWYAAFTGAVDQPAGTVMALVNAVRVDHPEASFGVISSTWEQAPRELYLRHDDETGRYDVVDRTTNPANSDRELVDELELVARLSTLLR